MRAKSNKVDDCMWEHSQYWTLFNGFLTLFLCLNLGTKQGLQLVGNSVNKVRELMIKIKNPTFLCDQLHALEY